MPATELNGKRMVVAIARVHEPDADRGLRGARCEGERGRERAARGRRRAHAGRIDVLVASLAQPVPSSSAVGNDEGEWDEVFTHRLDPLPRLARATRPHIIERRAVRLPAGDRRGAGAARCRGRGHRAELRRRADPFPPEVQADPRFRERLEREVPPGRLASLREDAEFTAYPCSGAAAWFVGQVFPVCGAWVQR